MKMEEYFEKFGKSFKKYFITGFLLILPLWLTVYILWLAIGIVGGVLSPLLIELFPDAIPDFAIKVLSFLLTVFLIWVFGLITANIIGKRMLLSIEVFIKKMPFVNGIYNSIKQFVKLVTTSKMDFKSVILFEFPRKGLYSLGFLTSNKKWLVRNEKMVNVFYPTTPNPTTGFFLLVPETDIIHSTLTIEEAVKIIMTAGVLTSYDESGIRVVDLPSPPVVPPPAAE